MTNEEKHIKIKEMLADPVQRQAILEAMAKGTEKRCQSEPHTVIDPKDEGQTNGRELAPTSKTPPPPQSVDK